MLTEPTLEKLHALRLTAMARSYQEQIKKSDFKKLDFDERFGLLVETEYIERENRKLARRQREAKLRIRDACVEDIHVTAQRGLDKAAVRQLGTCSWIQEHLNVLLTGPTGAGKSYIACALGQQACRKGFRVIYRRMPRLLHELALAQANGTFPGLLSRLSKVDVLILDDWTIADLTTQQSLQVYEVLEDRYDTRSTVATSQLPVSKWHERFSDPSLADAILDRLVHNAYKLEVKGASLRKDRRTKR